MKTTIRVENHQPVPLRSITEIVDELMVSPNPRAAVYLDKVVWESGTESRDFGWHIWDSGHWYDVDGTNDFWGENFSYEESTGRVLQPGEKLVVEFTN